MDISKIDKNFAINSNLRTEGVKYYNIDQEPFRIYGIYKNNGQYRRMPEDVAKSVSPGVYSLHTNTAGGRVRFVTDSQYIAISAKMDHMGKMSHFAFTGSIGFDLYAGTRYFGTFAPPIQMQTGFDGDFSFETKELREITINFPLYGNVMDLYIGLDENACLQRASDYKNEKPIVYYGSSITQGACACRPGTCYQNIISRRFNYDYINLGFSGNAKAEDEIIEYIKGLDMAAFVYDYDYNAPSAEHLEATHKKMFDAIRAKHPNLPIIIMSRPKHYLNKQEEQRLEIIKATYNSAVSSGDNNVYFISGQTLMELCGNEGTVDGCHPTDFGFASMAKALGDLIENIKIV